MGFIEEIKKCFSCAEMPKEPIYRAVIFGDSAGYFENVCAVAHYQSEEIALSLKRGGIVIKGEKLYIKKYCGGDVVVCGKIQSIERV